MRFFAGGRHRLREQWNIIQKKKTKCTEKDKKQDLNLVSSTWHLSLYHSASKTYFSIWSAALSIPQHHEIDLNPQKPYLVMKMICI